MMVFIRMEYCNNTDLCFIFFLYVFSLDCADYQWTRIRDEGAIALADPRVIKNFKRLE